MDAGFSPLSSPAGDNAFTRLLARLHADASQ
jgi:hypothetical protein